MFKNKKQTNFNTKVRLRPALMSGSAFCAAALFAGAGMAQETGDAGERRAGGLDTIIVTATKREESLQEVGDAVTALTGSQLNERGIDDLEDLQFSVPNFNMGQQLGAARISLRGVGLENLSAAAEGSIAFHGDGVFYSRPAATLSSFFDVDRVEVLRGPQGTLYGRNATGGSVNVISRKPTNELSGYMKLTGGNYSTVVAEGAIGGPIIEDKLLARIAIKAVERDGFGENIVTGADIDDASTFSVRGQLQYYLTDNVDVLLRAEYYEADDRNYGYHYINDYFDDDGFTVAPFGPLFGGGFAADPRDIAGDIDPKNDRDILTLSGEINAEFGEIGFKSITAYQEVYYLTASDLDVSSALVAPIFQSEDSHQFSQEIQFTYENDHWEFLLGAFYFDESVFGFIDVPTNNAIFGFDPGYLSETFFAGGTIDTKAYAVFGEAAYNITDRLKLTAGLRYSYEEKEGEDRFRFDVVTPDVPGAGNAVPPVLAMPSGDFSAVTPKFLIEYSFGDTGLIYASASRGFKSGGINLGGLQPAFEPELVWAYEAGVKVDLMDNRLRTNFAGFYYDYSDLQVGQVRNAVLVLENAATATIYGLEAEITAAPTEQLRFDIVASYLHAEYDEFLTEDQTRPALGEIQLAGNTLSQAPEFSVNFGAEYTLPTSIGEFTLRGEVFWVDDIYFTPYNLSSSFQGAHSRQNLFLNWRAPQGGLSAQLFVRNIDNDDDLANVFVSSGLVGSAIVGYYEEPRTFGGSLTYDF